MVLLDLMPSSLCSSAHSSDVNCGPLSEIRSAGTPKRANHCLMKAFATVSVLASGSGMASGHRVNLSMTVKTVSYTHLRAHETDS